MKEHLILVDASGFAFRAYYAFPPRYREKDGEPTGAIEGFMSMVWNMNGATAADRPTMAAAVFDAPGLTFRQKLCPDYKGNRDPARRSELDKQLPLMRPVANVLGLTPIEKLGFEADDVIATLACAAATRGIRVTIVSSDKDFGQLVVDGVIEIVDPMLKVRRRAADVEKKFGVPPRLVPDVQALAGDTVDNIKGVPGIGLKMASELVRKFGSLEGVLENASKCRRPMARAQLKRHADTARLCLKLTTLDRNVPLPGLKFSDLKVRPIVRSELVEIVKSIGAGARIEALFGLDPQNQRVVARMKDPLEWWREELICKGQKLPDEPQCGFYQRRLFKGGDFVPARIWREPEYDIGRDTQTGRDILQCEVGGKPRDPLAEWPRLSMDPIPRATFEKMRKAMPEPGSVQPPSPGKKDWTKHPTPSFKTRRKA